ncbi:class I SAM-dependent methyltransferase [Rhodoferax saidenbachensis]|uniref:SAM-dependent methyltransferase n=1 Tax=Rhodoferax saidenbachensis TaxID=1484693 RepID=A0A1P8KEL3_9BURK|nr:class I SAM-dependent methyltransferase [Rhodoferax saidenbachensis]APW44477.1 hypothetical protein RS694_19440 [Rhodoferax saidenbachensis]
MSYYDNVNQTILDLIPVTATSICEFGCGAGALARAVRVNTPNIYYVGVEIAEDQLALASEILDMGLLRNIDHVKDWDSDEELSLALPLNSFDHVILGDVLEHLYDPQLVMNEAARRLKPGGCAIVCIPNVQHWSVFANLVAGSWPRQDSGLFDRTHIRWFTLEDMVHLVESAGLSVETVVPRIFDEPKGLSVMEDLEALALNLSVSPDALIHRGMVLQFVLVGRKAL